MNRVSNSIFVGPRLRPGLWLPPAAFPSLLASGTFMVACHVPSDVHPWLNTLLRIPTPGDPSGKSTVAYPKSTLDLREEKLIWVKKWPVYAILPGSHRLFSPITTWKWKRANQNPTESDQKAKVPTLDLGCAASNPRWTREPFYSSIVCMASPSKAAGNNNPANPLPFEDALKKLEGIVEAMEADDLPLETLLAKYEEGSKLVTLCRGKLSEAELKIQQLEKNADKEMKLKPFEVEETI